MSRAHHRRSSKHRRSSSLSPLLNFTIPSIHDDTVLDCRIYLPDTNGKYRRQSSTGNDNGEFYAIRGAIVAHPYAPLGGTYDDRVVMACVATMLEAGIIVGTFNFRYD